MQLDIFEHSRDIMLRNDVLHALQRDDAVASRRALCVLTDEYAQDASLGPLDRLVKTLEQPADGAFADHVAATTALCALRDEIEPAARQLFGAEEADRWLKQQWHRLARRAEGLGFDADFIDVHSAPLYLHADDAVAAADAVARIPSRRRIPAPLAWMAEARWRRDGLDACWGLIAELAWLAPARCDTLLKRLPDPVLQRLRRRFDAEYEGEGELTDLAWWPAWLLTEQPALAAWLGQAQPGLASPPECGMRALLDLLHLERQGRQRELIEQRRQLRELNATLYAAYMKSR